jgi:hypothetical protein
MLSSTPLPRCNRSSYMKTDLLIVGGGSRALLVLERLASAVASAPDRALHVTIADPGVFGRGIHVEDQRPYITFNTSYSCPTIFFNDRIPGLVPAVRGPSLEEWLQGNGGDMSQRYQSRAAVGRYLAWSAQHLLANLPPNIRAQHIRECVTDVAPSPCDGLAFHTDASRTIAARAAVIVVGHSFSGAHTDGFSRARIIDNPFPTHIRLEGLDRRHSVAIRGMGLTALDVLAELTLGRGGRFEASANGGYPRYVPSGDEPKIVLYSRSSCPIRARPVGSDGGGVPFSPVVLCEDRGSRLLAGGTPLEFRTQVFPLILAELAHRLAAGTVPGLSPGALARIRDWRAGGGAGWSNAEICAFFRAPEIEGPLYDLMRPVLRDGIPGTRQRAIAFLREDIRESHLGIPGSSLKHALEVLLEARVFVKTLVDFRRDLLTDPHWLFGTFAQLVNRNTIGPQPERSAELVALLESGLVEILPAGAALDDLTVDTLIRADHSKYATSTQRGFIRSLAKSGLSRAIIDDHGTVMGLEVDQSMRLTARGLWAAGPICDGSAYYNNYVPCIQPDAEYPYREADRLARDVLEFLR